MSPMTVDKANGLIVSALAVNGVLAVTKAVHDNQMPTMRMAIGLTFAGVGLALLAQPFPSLAGGLAVLILVSGIFVHGGPVMSAVVGIVKPTN